MRKISSTRHRGKHHQRLQATLEVLNDPALMRQIKASLKYFEQGGKGRNYKEVFGETL